MANNNIEQISDVINLLTAGISLAANLGINIQDVSDAVLKARKEGRTLSQEEIDQFIEQWRQSDEKETEAYNARMGYDE